MRPIGSDRLRVSLTPGGAGVFSLFFPGLLICAVARHRLLLAVSVSAGLILVVNMMVARVALRRLVFEVLAPSTATVGTSVGLTIGLTTGSGISGVRASPLECAVGVEHGERGWIPVLAPAEGEARVTFVDRGVNETLEVRVRTSVPFGLTSCVRAVNVVLSEPLHVAPAAVPTPVPQLRADGGGASAVGGGETIGLRAYVPGDPQRDVHWPTVARTGTMMVRDRRILVSPPQVTVSVAGWHEDDLDPDLDSDLDPDLDFDPDSDLDFDLALGRARATAEQLMAGGHVVLLATIDGSEQKPLTEQVCSSSALLARLARAQPGRNRAGSVPDLVAQHLVVGEHLVVDRNGVRWQPGS